MKLNKIGEVWNSKNRLLSDFIGLLSSKSFATTATWRNDFSSLLLLFLLEYPERSWAAGNFGQLGWRLKKKN